MTTYPPEPLQHPTAANAEHKPSQAVGGSFDVGSPAASLDAASLQTASHDSASLQSAAGASSADLAAVLQEAAKRLTMVAPESPAVPPAGFSSDDPSQRASRLIQLFLGFLEKGEFASLSELVSEDFVYRIPGRSRISGVYEGLEGLTAASSIIPRPGARELGSKLSHLSTSPSGNFVASFHSMTGILDNQAIEIEIALRFEIVDGRISVITEYCADQYVADDLFGS